MSSYMYIASCLCPHSRRKRGQKQRTQNPQTDDAHNPPASGACVLYSLPLHLIHEITRNLDLRSQRNLFMCSSQLYSKWHLHVPDHTDWQVVHRSVNLLEEGLCHANSHIRILFAPHQPGNPWFRVTCQRQDQSMLFSIQKDHSSRGTVNQIRPSGSEVIWSGMTKDQLWHRLASAPDIACASMEHAHLSAVLAEIGRVLDESLASKAGVWVVCEMPVCKFRTMHLQQSRQPSAS